MQRYFVNKLEDDTFFIDGDDAHHIVRVMRMEQGDELYCCINGKTALCIISELSSTSVQATAVEWIEERKELPIFVTIASGLPKGDKLELVFQKGTELGASAFLPFQASRSIVKWDGKKSEKKVERWAKIVKEAAEQSHRAIIPSVHEPISFQKLLSASKEYDVCIVAYEEEAKRGEKANFAKALETLQNGQRLLIVFGPEGGLTEQEIENLLKHGYVSCSLGPRILRTETAPLYALSAVSYHFELTR